MKKIIPLLLIFLMGCSDYDECNCDRVLDAVTFQHDTPQGIRFETVCVVENTCNGVVTVQERRKNSYNSWDIPIKGQCFK
jgi:hypothetical protein